MTVAQQMVVMATLAAATECSSDRPPLARPPRHLRCSPAIVPGTLLVVDDDASTRDASVADLRGRGYQVLAAARGYDALTLLDAHQGRVDLLITRTSLPDMSGYVLAARVLLRRPAVRVLFITGDIAGSIVAVHTRVAALIDRRRRDRVA
jgi:CheY-like chemotaxis protein